MISAGRRSVAAPFSNRAGKRKASNTQDIGVLLRKKQKAQVIRLTAQPQKKEEAEPDATKDTGIIVVGDNAREPVKTTPSTAPLALPAGQPPMYSNIRAALCDSIHFWKTHQGGIQSTNMVATGMLLNGKTTPRDVLRSQVIVTTVYGSNQQAFLNKHNYLTDGWMAVEVACRLTPTANISEPRIKRTIAGITCVSRTQWKSDNQLGL